MHSTEEQHGYFDKKKQNISPRR